MKKIETPLMDRFVYVIFCLLSLGGIYLLKTIIVNALVEYENLKLKNNT